MGPRTYVFFLLAFLHFAQPAISADTVNGGEEVKRALQDAEKRVAVALRKADPSVLSHVRAQLIHLEEVALSDLKAIADFTGPGDKEQAVEASKKFWISRMEEGIQVYLEDPEKFKNVKFSSDSDLPADPKNNTREYMEAASEIERLAKEAKTELVRRHSEVMIGGPVDVGQVTAWTARQEGARMALDAALSTVAREGQYAKVEADRGHPELGIARFKHSITAAKSNFESNIRDIFSSLPIPPVTSA